MTGDWREVIHREGEGRGWEGEEDWRGSPRMGGETCRFRLGDSYSIERVECMHTMRPTNNDTKARCVPRYMICEGLSVGGVVI